MPAALLTAAILLQACCRGPRSCAEPECATVVVAAAGGDAAKILVESLRAEGIPADHEGSVLHGIWVRCDERRAVRVLHRTADAEGLPVMFKPWPPITHRLPFAPSGGGLRE